MIKRLEKLVELKAGGVRKDFSSIIGIRQQTFNNYMNGTRCISLEAVLHILSAFPDIFSDWLLFGKGKMLSDENSTTISEDGTGDAKTLRIELDKANARIHELSVMNTKLQTQIEYLEERNTRLILTLNKYEKNSSKI